MVFKAFRHPRNAILLDGLGSETKGQILLSFVYFAVSAWCYQICGNFDKEVIRIKKCLGHLTTTLRTVNRSQSKY